MKKNVSSNSSAEAYKEQECSMENSLNSLTRDNSSKRFLNHSEKLDDNSSEVEKDAIKGCSIQ
jgi:hypothetical protein